MGAELGNGLVFIKMTDGEYMPIINVEPVTDTFDSKASSNKTEICTCLKRCEYEASFSMSKKSQKRFAGLVVYGWRAKGPLRKKSLIKACQVCAHRFWRLY